ncbi:MAG: hypothetical protein EXR51_08890 [Dehalococcoidia bacterium]|nr:hypothetical protein [Dehalococcoidia bacterium]
MAPLCAHLLNNLGIFDEINPIGFPATVPLLHLVLTYEAGPAEYEREKTVRIVLLGAGGEQLVSLEQPVRIPRPVGAGAHAYVNQIVAFGGIVFAKPGDYSFAILVDDDEKSTLPFHVNETTSPGPEGSPENA